jgi:2-methylcitrate dehydratase PrpD
MTQAQAIADFVSTLRLEDLPGGVIVAAKRAVLDCLGAALFGTTTEWAHHAREYVQGYGSPGRSHVIGTPWTAAPRDAALLNGLAAHGFELDDTHVPSSSHPGCVVIPAALAAIGDEKVDGRRFLTGIVAGYEVMTRAGMAVAPDHLERGFHPTATGGVFGAATAAATILGLNGSRIVSAFGIAGSLASGLTEFAHDPWGDMVKRLHAGTAAANGLLAAQLAASGYRGPRSVFEGRHGFVRTFGGKPAAARLTKTLGRTFELVRISVKPYACCSNLFAAIDAVKHLMAAGITPDSVREVTVYGNLDQVRYHAARTGLATIGAAQYSIPYAVAATLHGVIDDPAQAFSERTIRDPRLAAVCKKTRVKPDMRIHALFPKHEAARVVVRLRTGRTAERMVKCPKGSPGNPLSQEELEGKFRRLAGSVPHGPDPERLREGVLALDSVVDMRDILRLLECPRAISDHVEGKGEG